VAFGPAFNGVLRGHNGMLGSMPGTILRIPDPSPPGPGVAFGSAGYSRSAPQGSSPLPLWTIEGTINSSTLAPGSMLTVTATIRIASPVLASAAPCG
jgi:hypothetical protein